MTEKRSNYMADGSFAGMRIEPPASDVREMDAFRVIDDLRERNGHLRQSVACLEELLAAAESERAALRARVAELEAKAAIADSVPWEAIERLLGYNRPHASDARTEVLQWFAAHAPQE